MIDTGAGPPVVLVPGIQGRWEWMRPTVRALACHCRVLTFSLPGEPGSRRRENREPAGFERLLEQVDEALDQARVQRAVICGVSFGGLIALRYAARHPDRVSALVLVSAPGPEWRPDERLRHYLRAPRRRALLFLAGALRRLFLELRTTFPTRRARWAFLLKFCWVLLRAPASPSRMARRANMVVSDSFAEDCRKITVPTLVITGESGTDRVVPPEGTLEYVESIPGARSAILERTGHLGLVTRPERFAAIVGAFVRSQAAAGEPPAGQA